MNRIKEIAQYKGLTINRLIKEAGLSKSYMYDIINDKSMPTVVVAKKISNVLNVKIEDLFPDDDKQNVFREVQYET